jgi:hypothetical protein
MSPLYSALAFASTLAFASAQELKEFDLIAGAIDGHALAKETMESVTDWLGRPSFVHKSQVFEMPGADAAGKPRPPRYFGATLGYASRGFLLDFNHKHDDATEGLHGITVFLSRTSLEWDTSASYGPSPVKLSRDMSSQWKKKKLMEAFADYSPIDELTDEVRSKIHANAVKDASLGIDFDEPGAIRDAAKVTFVTPAGLVVVHYEVETGFLESVFVHLGVGR